MGEAERVSESGGREGDTIRDDKGGMISFRVCEWAVGSGFVCGCVACENFFYFISIYSFILFIFFLLSCFFDFFLFFWCVCRIIHFVDFVVCFCGVYILQNDGLCV